MEEHQRQFRGVWFPKEIWLNKELSPLEKTFLVEIDSLEDKEKGCWASNKHFTDFFGITSTHVSRTIQNLKNKGYVTILYNRNGKEIESRHIFVNRPPYPEKPGMTKLDIGMTENENRYDQIGKGGMTENVKDNNTYINNTNNNIKKFQKPTPDEIQQYCIEKEFDIDTEYFYDYYESNGWIVGKSKMKDWKATLRNWARRENKTSKKQIIPKWSEKEIANQEIDEKTKQETEDFKEFIKNL